MAMERLTIKTPNNPAVPVNFALDFVFGLDNETWRGLSAIFERLAEYEDTGLSPVTVNALNSLATLAKEHRLLVLPCAIGTPVFVHEILCQAGMRLTYANCKYGQDCDRNDFIKCPLRVVKRPFTLKMRDGLGVKFWLTQEEAEAAIPEDQRPRP